MRVANANPTQRVALALAAATLALHLAGNAHYGFFRDELYFIVCGRHPAFGYVDQPPIVPLLAAGSKLFGTSLFALRAIPALFSAAATYAVCILAADMGGTFALLLAALCATLAPVQSAFGTVLGPDTVQILAWPLAILFIGRALHRSPNYWLAVGIVLGLASEAKYSAIIATTALATGVLLTRHRRAVQSPWFLLGILAAASIILPNALWQAMHGMPMLELLRNGQHGKNVALTPANFRLHQSLLTNPTLALVWIVGIAWCLAKSPWRWLGFGTMALLAIMIVLHGKAYYPTPIYGALFAAGAVAIENLLLPGSRLKPAILVLAFAAGLPFLPLTLPILPEQLQISYVEALSKLGIAPKPSENHTMPAIGQEYADMHGWQELADTVTRLYQQLPPETRARTNIFAANYGEAAAIDVLAPPGALPPVISGHNQYWLWGPRSWDGRSLIDVGGDLDADKQLCESAIEIGKFEADFIMPYENGKPIILCTNLKPPVADIWPRLKHYE